MNFYANVLIEKSGNCICSPDKQHTRIPTTTTTISLSINATPQTTKPPQPLTTTLTKIKISDNHKLPTHLKKSKTSTKKHTAPIYITPNEANVVEEIIEKPCIKRNYYKLGGTSVPSPSLTIQKQQNAATIATSKPYKLSQTNGKTR